MTIRREKRNRLAIKPVEGREGLITRQPFDIWTDMDEIFNRFRTDFYNLSPFRRRSELNTFTQTRTPPMDIVDLGDKYEMHAEIPGVSKEEINIEVTPTEVEISAEHNENKENKGKNWLRQERSSTNFYRFFELPEELKTDDAEAEMKDGILTITLPKVEPKPEHKPKKINVK